jgi:hypothetical protein
MAEEVSHQDHKEHKEHKVAGDRSSTHQGHLKTAIACASDKLVSRKDAKHAKIAKISNQPVQRATFFIDLCTLLLPSGLASFANLRTVISSPGSSIEANIRRWC